jgi:uncharacterized Tic20 family protein
MKQNTENTNAFLIHISAFAGFIFPFGNIITPLVAWQTLKKRSPFLDEHGKEAINFNISYALYFLIFSVFASSFFIGDFFRNFNGFNSHNHFNFHVDTENVFGFLGLGSVAGIVYLIGMVLVIIAAIKAKEGESYKYPFTIQFIK